jgi:hypothetical protein
VPPTQISLPPNLAITLRAHDGWFVTSDDPAEPVVGDVRVRFEQVPAGRFSVIAWNEQGQLQRPRDAALADLVMLRRGTHTADAMFDSAGRHNSRVAWLLRGAGFVLAWIGFGLMLKPIALLAGAVPLFGRFAGVGTTLVAGMLAAIFSVLAISGGWLWSRPWMIGAMVLLVGVMLALLLRRRARPVELLAERSTAEPTLPPPPPPASTPASE